MANILILKFPYSSTFGGGERHTLSLVDNLSNHNWYLLSTCSVLLPEFQKRNIPTQTIWAGIEPVTAKALLVFFITWPFIWFNLLRTVLRYKRHQKVDTLYCLSLTEKVLLTPWARLFGLKVIWVEHLQIERWLLSSPLRLLYVLWSRFATIITVVEAVKKQLVAIGVGAKHIEVIYNSVNVEHYQPTASSVSDITNSFNVTFIGRIAEEKGLADLLQAAQRVMHTIPNVKFTIVGQGPWQAELEQMIANLKLEQLVQLPGFQTDIAPWLEQASVVVLPSTRRETFGIILAEALAMEKPVITTTTGGVQEVVGDCGYIVEPHQPGQLADTLQHIYNNYPEALTKAKTGRQRVLELFNEQRMIQAYDQLFTR